MISLIQIKKQKETEFQFQITYGKCLVSFWLLKSWGIKSRMHQDTVNLNDAAKECVHDSVSHPKAPVVNAFSFSSSLQTVPCKKYQLV
jgi:hypothetical protein